MKKLIFLFSLIVIVVYLLSNLIPTTGSENMAYLPSVSNNFIPTEAPVPTIDPLLLVSPETVVVRMTAEAIKLDPILNYVVESMNFGADNSVSSGIVLDISQLKNVPVMENFGPPCTPGATSAMTSSGNYWNPNAHRGLDTYCSDLKVAASSKAMVYAVLVNNENAAQQYWSSGYTVIEITRFPEDFKMKGYLLSGTGHMWEINVKVGQIVEGGQVLGLMGSTGNSTGPHMHHFKLWLKEDGTTEFLDPNDWKTLGTR